MEIQYSPALELALEQKLQGRLERSATKAAFAAIAADLSSPATLAGEAATHFNRLCVQDAQAVEEAAMTAVKNRRHRGWRVPSL